MSEDEIEPKEVKKKNNQRKSVSKSLTINRRRYNQDD